MSRLQSPRPAAAPLPLPACAMVVLGSIAVVTVVVEATLSGLLVAVVMLTA